MTNCPKCGAPLRVYNVEENKEEHTAVMHMTCANPRCENYKTEVCENTVQINTPAE